MFVILALLLVLGISWVLTCGWLYLIALCFSWVWSWKIATGIWLILLLLGAFFKPTNSKK